MDEIEVQIRMESLRQTVEKSFSAGDELKLLMAKHLSAAINKRLSLLNAGVPENDAQWTLVIPSDDCARFLALGFTALFGLKLKAS